jgi:hypothetical protein
VAKAKAAWFPPANQLDRIRRHRLQSTQALVSTPAEVNRRRESPGGELGFGGGGGEQQRTVSNDTLVLILGLVKIIARVLPAKGL